MKFNILLIVLLTIAACGGGGGGSPDSPTVTDSPPAFDAPGVVRVWTIAPDKVLQPGERADFGFIAVNDGPEPVAILVSGTNIVDSTQSDAMLAPGASATLMNGITNILVSPEDPPPIVTRPFVFDVVTVTTQGFTTNLGTFTVTVDMQTEYVPEGTS